MVGGGGGIGCVWRVEPGLLMTLYSNWCFWGMRTSLLPSSPYMVWERRVSALSVWWVD